MAMMPPPAEDNMSENHSTSSHHTSATKTIVAPLAVDEPDTLEKGSPPAKPEPVYPEGGWEAYSSLFGAWLVLFCTFGYTSSFGVFQSYYLINRYSHQSSSSIAWIGSVQTFLQFTLAGVAGPLFDKGYFYSLYITGSIIFIVSFFMTSLCTKFWQAFLAQGVGIGIGIGFLFLPAVAVTSQFFLKYRGIATGFVATGSSVGGICLPIMLNRLIASKGFERGVQYTGYLELAIMAIALAFIRPFGGVRAHKAKASGDVNAFFREKGYVCVCLGVFLVTWGLFFPIFFIQVFGEVTHTSPRLIPYLLAMLNAGSVLGRTLPNFFADRFGALNLFTIMCFLNSVMAFALFGAQESPGGLIAVTVIYGITSGSFISLLSPALFGFAKTQGEIGKRVGMALMIMSLASLTGTPIGGALVDKHGFSAAIVFCGVIVAAGGCLIGLAAMSKAREKKTWKV